MSTKSSAHRNAPSLAQGREGLIGEDGRELARQVAGERDAQRRLAHGPLQHQPPLARHQDQDQACGENHDDADHVGLRREQASHGGEVLLALLQAQHVAAEGEQRQAHNIDRRHEDLQSGLIMDGGGGHGDRHHPGDRKDGIETAGNA